ncbi:MAG: S41 family peptidase [Flavobacteriales bacterium]|nr:S41 family peptidase [Flavobacteriales bacterium]
MKLFNENFQNNAIFSTSNHTMSEEIQNEKSGKSPLQPLYYAFVLIAGILIGTVLADKNLLTIKTGKEDNPNKLVSLIDFIEDNYVDGVDKKKIIDDAIASILKNLDPHSYYLNPQEYAKAREEMSGSYQGVGVEFLILRDSLMVNRVVPFGPSFRAGIQSGDRIVQVDGKDISGKSLNNKGVMKMLKGEAGSNVNISVLRKKEYLNFNIERGSLPLTSVPSYYKIEEGLGYIKIDRFAKTTYDEFLAAGNSLRNQGCSKFILDLRGNGGGLLEQATSIAEEFLEKDRLMVYTTGTHSGRNDYNTQKRGAFADVQVTVLIDEYSASASEIVAGALQDWDRAIVVGRRSFGKGLVQSEIELPDKSALRLTTARYYTPTGRCIQKPYGDSSKYFNETHQRWLSGELFNQEKISHVDSLKFYTPSGRVVYGGGGITPNVFIPFDSTSTSFALIDIVNFGILRYQCFDYVDQNRAALANWKSFGQYQKTYKTDDALIDKTLKAAVEQNITYSTAEVAKLRSQCALRFKAQIARALFDENAMIRIMNGEDPELLRAVEISKNYNTYFYHP